MRFITTCFSRRKKKDFKPSSEIIPLNYFLLRYITFSKSKFSLLLRFTETIIEGLAKLVIYIALAQCQKYTVLNENQIYFCKHLLA